MAVISTGSLIYFLAVLGVLGSSEPASGGDLQITMSHKNVFKSPEAITITCTATGQSAPPNVVMWRDEKGKTPQFLNVTLKSNNTVTTATYMSGNSNMSMSGSYVCVATEDGKVKGESINIDVKERVHCDRFRNYSDKLDYELVIRSKEKADNHAVYCSAEGNPSPNIVWYNSKNETMIKGTSKVPLNTTVGKGDFYCCAWNSLNIDEKGVEKHCEKKYHIFVFDLVTEEQVLISAKEHSYPLYCNATLTKELKPNVRWEHKLGGKWEEVVQGVTEDSKEKDGMLHKILEIDNKYNGPHEFQCIADLEGPINTVVKHAQSYKNFGPINFTGKKLDNSNGTVTYIVTFEGYVKGKLEDKVKVSWKAEGLTVSGNKENGFSSLLINETSHTFTALYTLKSSNKIIDRCVVTIDGNEREYKFDAPLLSTNAIIGIVIALIVLVLIVAGICLICKYRTPVYNWLFEDSPLPTVIRKRKRSKSKSTGYKYSRLPKSLTKSIQHAD